MTGDGEFVQRMEIEGDLGLWLSEHIWSELGTLRLGDGEFEPVGSDDAPGYEGDDTAILLRRKSDGKLFEIDIEVTARTALEMTR